MILSLLPGALYHLLSDKQIIQQNEPLNLHIHDFAIGANQLVTDLNSHLH